MRGVVCCSEQRTTAARMQARVNTASCCAARAPAAGSSPHPRYSLGRTVRDLTALRATWLPPATASTPKYLSLSQSAQNVMSADTTLRTVRQGDTGGSAKRQSRLGRDTSVRGGAVCAQSRWPLPRTNRPPKAETQRRPNLANETVASALHLNEMCWPRITLCLSLLP